MSDLITIDPNDIVKLAKEGEKFVFKPEAEQSLKQLLLLQEQVDNAVEQAKEAIGKAGREIDPDFKGVVGEDVHCVYREYGKKYKYDYDKEADARPFLSEVQYFNVDSDKVDKYVEEVGELPDGVYENEREPKLSIKWDK